MTRGRELDERLPKLLDEMLSSAAEITAGSVSRRLNVAASTITRNVQRREQVFRYQQEQNRIKAVSARTDAVSREKLVRQIAERDEQIAELNRSVQILTASHKALLIAVGEMGGTAAWQRFFANYERIRMDLRQLSAVDE
jgi:hypothetical protein